MPYKILREDYNFFVLDSRIWYAHLSKPICPLEDVGSTSVLGILALLFHLVEGWCVGDCDWTLLLGSVWVHPEADEREEVHVFKSRGRYMPC